MNSMDLFKAFGNIDDALVFDAIQGGAQPQPSAGAAPVKQPKNNVPRRGGAKTRAIVIGAVAMVLVAAIVCMILYFTGVFGGKQIPIYTGMEISATNTSADDGSTKAVSYKYSGDYTGRYDDVDKNNPYGDSGSALDQQLQSTLQIVSAGDTIYYANAGDDIYVKINFDNPDKYDIVSFSLSDGTNTYDFSGLLGNFEDGSTYEQIIIKLNVGTQGGIIEYTISKIKYLDDNSVNSDVYIGGDTVVRCGVLVSNMTYAEITDETVTLTSISFTVNIVDKYSLIDYSNGYVKAVLFDGSTLVNIIDLQVGDNTVLFDNLTPDTLYQYAVAAYYDDLTGGGAALNYLYTNALYTPAIVLFDEDSIVIDQESITFDYSWYDEVGTITSLTLTGGGETVKLDASTTSITGLLSNNDYTLTATYALTNGDSGTITLEFTTETKATPNVEITVTDATVSTLTFNVDYTDTDGVGAITAIELYNGDVLVQSETNLNQVEYTYSGLDSYTEYTLKVSYSYDLNDGVGTQTAEAELTENTDPLVELESLTFMNKSAISENDTIVLQASMNNPDGVTFTSVVINGETYAASALGTKTSLVIEIVYSDQFAGGTTVLTVTQVNCTIGGNSYSVAVSANNTASVFIYGELTVEDFSVVRYNSTSNEYEQTDYGFASEQLYYRISLSNETGYSIDTITIDSTVYSTSDMTISSDYQTVIIKATDNNGNIQSHTLSKIEYSYETSDFTRTDDISLYYVRLSSDDVVEITTADQLKNMVFNYDIEYKYYKLMNDIDLSGTAWVNMNNYMYGVFDGNGHTIKNIGAVATYTNTSLNIGLFTSAQGVIKNLTISNMLYIVTLNNSNNGTYDINAGGIAAYGEYMFISNVDVSASIKVINTNKVQYVCMGGLIGDANSSIYKTENITVEAVLACEFGQTLSVSVGGLYGAYYAFGGKPITNVTVDLTADISATGDMQSYVGGIIGVTDLYSGFTISNVTVSSDVAVKHSSDSNNYITLGGVVGYAGELYGIISFYDVTSEMTANLTYDSINMLNYNEFVNEDNPYIDESCTGTITVTENS